MPVFVLRRCPECGRNVSAQPNKHGHLVMVEHGFTVDFREDGRDAKKHATFDVLSDQGFKRHSGFCKGTGQPPARLSY